MSRGKLRHGNEVCADCNASDPGWASINRGVLICDECCSVHRSLGRHISHVKSLKKGLWNPTQLQMVHQLVTLGANNIWEHTLLDPGQSSSSKQARRKPNAHDPLHPTKADFIRAKYLVLAFAKKQQAGDPCTLDDLNKQLHSCVRTSNLEITLRLLSQGADPNVLNTERGNYPLHVAAQSGQPTQAELLIIYGADPGALDVAHRTPGENAKNEGHNDIAERLLECEYELTDRLSYYLCGRKPDHLNQHFIVPQMADSSLDLSELAKAAKKKLHLLSNRMFEELSMDVYDEVDRRENDAIWLSTQNHSTLITDRQSVPFLPVNPELSATRNQGRQKLARFNAREFATLVIDILTEARRRQLGIINPAPPAPNDHQRETTADDQVTNLSKSLSNLSDDEPLYDEVASDDDYSPIDTVKARENRQRLEAEKAAKRQEAEKAAAIKAAAVAAGKEINEWVKKCRLSPTSMISFTEFASRLSMLGESKSSLASSETQSTEFVSISAEEYNEVKKSLSQSEAKVQQMASVNRDLKQEVNKLHGQLNQLMQENQSLKQLLPINGHGHNDDVIRRSSGRGQLSPGRPQSMFESRDQQKPVPRQFLPLVVENETHHHSQSPHHQQHQHHTPLSPLHRQHVHSQHPQPTFSTIREHSRSSSPAKQWPDDKRVTPHHGNEQNNDDQPEYDQVYQSSAVTRLNKTGHSSSELVGPAQRKLSSSSSHQAPSVDVATSGPLYHPDDVMPSQDDVVRKTERITKEIQELLISAQEGKHHSYVTCSDKIHTVVVDMAAIFPLKPKTETVRQAVQALTTSALRLKEECRNDPVDVRGHIDYRLKTQQVIQCAYDIAKAAKQLVTLFQ